MSEAWLLISEPAIRSAAGNPNGTTQLTLPSLSHLERTPDPKQVLRDCLLSASNLTGRRRHQLQRELPQRIHRVAQLIPDYSPLMKLPAFKRLYAPTGDVLGKLEGEAPDA